MLAALWVLAACTAWLQPGGTMRTQANPSAAAPVPAAGPDRPVPSIPPRPAGAETGASFMKRLACLPAAEREEEILRAALAGNIPEFLRSFRRVTIRGKDAAGFPHTIVLEVAPDYFSIGSDADFCRTPMALRTAQAIAARYGCLLPTSRIVDEIYRAAEIRLSPRPLVAEREAVTTFVQHNAIIEEQRGDLPLGPIVAGIKKDIILANRLLEREGRLAIYGWHRADGTAIQPVSTVHRDAYVDYSHGVRLIGGRISLDGNEADLARVLRDPNLALLLSVEGALRILGY